MYPLYDVIKIALYLCDLPKNPKTQSDYEKNNRLIPIQEHSKKYLSSTPHNCEGHQKQRKSNKLSQARGV